MAIIRVGDTIKDLSGNNIYIKKMIDSNGGQGRVFLVDYCGKEKVLKWYKDRYLQKLRESMVRCDRCGEPLKKGAPKQEGEMQVSGDKVFYNALAKKPNIAILRDNKEFVWPLAVTPWNGAPNESFGYIMDYIDKKVYTKLSEIINNPEVVYWKSTGKKLTACLNIAKNLRILHAQGGLSYQDLSGGNVWVNKETGDVLIADNDNVMPNGVHISGLSGTPGYMAPEVVVGKSAPSELTDRFSLAVLFFQVLMNGPHPFEGPYSKKNDESVFYGSDPVCMFDPKDDRNRPAIGKYGEQTYARHSWEQMPIYIKNLFAKVFYKEFLVRPKVRPDEEAWITALLKMRGEQFTCPYCRQNNKLTAVMVDVGINKSVTCRVCGKSIDIPKKILQFRGISDVAIRLIPTQVIYQSQYNSMCEDYTKELFKVTQQGRVLRIINKSGRTMEARMPNGMQVSLKMDDSLEVQEGLKIAITRNNIATVKVLT